jgi:hypothetical protein
MVPRSPPFPSPRTGLPEARHIAGRWPRSPTPPKGQIISNSRYMPPTYVQRVAQAARSAR